MIDNEPGVHTAADAVDMILQPDARRQLGDEGVLVFWRAQAEPDQREGLACILSMCPHPECACQLVYVDGFVIDGSVDKVSWDRLSGKRRLILLDSVKHYAYYFSL